MFKYINYIACVAAAVAFIGCGDGGGSSSGGAASSANGLWAGTQVVDGTPYDIEAIVYEGEVVAISFDAYTSFRGSYSMNGDQMSGSYKLYYGDGSYLGNGSLTAAVDENATLNGSFSNSLGENGTITAGFDSQYYNPASLSSIAGTYSNGITISASGAVSGFSVGCTVSGTVHTPDPSVNIYDISIELSGSGCAAAGTYDGLGTVVSDDGIQHYLLLGVSNSNVMILQQMDLD